MTIYIVSYSLTIREVFFNVDNLAQFKIDMNDAYGDSWFDNMEDAKEYLYELGMKSFNVDCGGFVTLNGYIRVKGRKVV